MQSYPSPNAGVADGGGPFYSSSGPPQPGIPSPDALQHLAQQSRNLAPIMSASLGGNMTDSQDPRGPNQGMNQGNVSHQYGHDGLPSPQIQQSHGPMDPMGSQYGTPDGSMAPRKRSKVSRACDECRRKKVRCDATGESENEQCANCKRVGANCQFTRLPMKRGPSKGYIKELADRLVTLESQVQGTNQSGDLGAGYLSQHESPNQRRSEEFSPPPNPDNQRKRQFSAVSNDFGNYLPQRNPTSWSPSDPARHLPHPTPVTYASQPATQAVFKEPNYSTNGMPTELEWRGAPQQHSQTTFAGSSGPEIPPTHVLDWDESVVDSYYQYIQPTFKLLETNKARLRARIDSSPSTLKTAFFEALQSAVRSVQHHPAPQSIDRAAHLLISVQSDTVTPRSLATDFLYLQTLLLLAIATNSDPSTTMRPRYALAKSSWLADAVEFAYSMKLHQHKQLLPGDDDDSEDKIALRLWWALVTMDRWYAASTGRPALIPDPIITVYKEEHNALGESHYQLGRLSIILEHISQIFAVTDSPDLGFRPNSVYGTLVRGELERFRESLPDTLFPSSQAPILHICYWHLRLLVEMTLAESDPDRMLEPALHSVTQLNINPGLFSPLVHYCKILTALTLIELLEYENTRDQAEEALKSLLDRASNSGWDAAVRELITNRLQRPSSASLGTAESSKQASVASQSLQRLADIATATEGRDAVGGEERKEGDKSASALVPAAATPFKNYANLRKLVSNGFLFALPAGGESAR
ncbi:related to RGT1 Regulator of glucose-induced genes [Phialocephala subalpina]|uniref:Related to RGT1 Regulator of glucose-induced genes n=1 Tax=Phialocephala subalpina TaxID=576137 RepID=A0A1L7WGV2_9HELO|nr:related to RGT1 Regulator of glucose-induced genes [Phialocephala subalpina]